MCIVVENCTYPLDRRVYLEATALSEEGYEVAVIAPAGEGQSLRERVGLVEVWRYPLPQADGVAGYVREYGTALLRVTQLLMRLAAKRRPAVVQVCNPPDLLFLPALPLLAFGTKLVFDHHDPVPELFAKRFSGKATRLVIWLLKVLEGLSVRVADLTISVNDSCRQIVIARDGADPTRTAVVRMGPVLDRFARVTPDRDICSDGVKTVGYVGLMAPQDGVRILVDVARELRGVGVSAFRFLLIGDGPELPIIRERIHALGLDGFFDIRGLISDYDHVLSLLAACDVAVVPDPRTPANDVSTFIKVLEYMGLGLPIVATDLKETRASAGDAAVYVEPGSAAHMAEALRDLLNDPVRQRQMSQVAQERLVSHRLAWDFQRENLIDAYRRLTGPVPRVQRVPTNC